MPAGETLTTPAVDTRYRYLAKLGSGGMADVFLGVQGGDADFRRLVVIKRVRSVATQDEDALRLFVTEARVVATLNHPHIVKIFDLSRIGNDVCIAMEYVDGETLEYLRKAARDRQQPIPIPVVCKLMIEACDALHYAHSARTPQGVPLNLVHRDIGANNLMIDGNGYLKVIDFGIAKSNVDVDGSAPGTIKGKFAYLAPEVFKNPDIDRRVDIYALGLVFWEMLTLERCYVIDAESSLEQVVQRIVNEPVPSVATVNPDLPEDLDVVIGKASHKDREQRYASAEELAAAIREVAAKHGGVASARETREWFQQTFAERIAKRREYERRVLSKARDTQGSSGEDLGLVTARTADISAMVTALRKGEASPPPSPPLPRRSVHPLLLAVVLCAVAGAGALVAYLVLAGRPRTEVVLDTAANQDGMSDNLFVMTDPPGADVTVDDGFVGTSGTLGLSLRIEPGRPHVLTLQKEGYDDYILEVNGESVGQRRVHARLDPVKEDDSEAAGPDRKSHRKHKGLGKGRPIVAGAKTKVGGAAEESDDEGQEQGNGGATPATGPSGAGTATGGSTAGSPPPRDGQGGPEAGAEAMTAGNGAGAAPGQGDGHAKEAEPAAPIEPVYQSPNDLLGRRVEGTNPEYPRMLRDNNISGKVKLRVGVDPDGNVDEVTFLEDDAKFRSSVERCVRAWRFKPYEQNGKRVRTYSIFKLTFNR